MTSPLHTLACHALVVLGLAATAAAQIPDGWYVHAAFNPKHGRIGIFASHPRTPDDRPVPITGLQGDLTITGSSCILRRPSDGALIVGERSPTDSSVDVHVITLRGFEVHVDACFSVGTGGPCCGEIPQMALLPDERIVVAATDLSAGPLKNIQTTSYGWQGLGIVDPNSGLITPIPISNGASIVDVFNGLALAPDAQHVYVGTYVSASQGDIWRVPVSGGAAVLVASVPAGLSNLGFDAAGDLWVTTLDAAQGLFRVDVTTGKVTKVLQKNGSLNAIALEHATGNFAVASANAGQPARALFWMEPSGAHHLLADPGFGTISGVAVNPDPELFGRPTAGTASYRWLLPNPAGLPLVGNAGFGITVQATGPAMPGLVALATGRIDTPIPIFGAEFLLDPARVFWLAPLPVSAMHLALPIPANPTLVGVRLAAQSLHLEGPTSLATTAALEFTVL